MKVIKYMIRFTMGLRAVAAFSCVLLVTNLVSQPKMPILESASGFLNTKHFGRDAFKGDPQFWTVCEDSLGVLYFGNNDGGLVYNGEHWQTVMLPNKSSIRSMEVVDGKIYASGFNEFGTIEKNEFGEYAFHSLADSLHLSELNLEMIWQIHSVRGKLILRTFENLVVISGASTAAINGKSSFTNAFTLGNRYYVQTADDGVQELDFDQNQVKPLLPANALNNDFIVSIYETPSPQEILAISKAGKIYMINTLKNEARVVRDIFKSNEKDKVMCSVGSDKRSIIAGTLNGVLYKIETFGAKDPISVSEILKSENTILDLFSDAEANVWVLLNNGLTYIDFNSAKTTLFHEASIYDVREKDGQVYLATNKGVLKGIRNTETAQLQFEILEGLEGQAWKICEVNDNLFAAHDIGLFVQKADGFEKVGAINGVWTVIPIHSYQDRFLVCTYSGIYILVSDKEGPRISHKVEGFDISARDIIAADTPGEFWVCHGYDGVYKIQLSPDLERISAFQHFTTNSGLPSHFNVNAFRWQDQLVFTTNQGIYQFDEPAGKFVPHAYLNDLLNSDVNYRRLLEAYDKTWFVEDDELGYFETNKPDHGLHKNLFMELKGTFNRGMECILPLGENKVLVGTNSGLYRYTIPEALVIQNQETNITAVTFQTKQNGERQKLSLAEQGAELHEFTTFLKFQFATPGFNKASDITYSYKLEGVDQNWSEWRTGASKEYSHLPTGAYTFHVRSKSLAGELAKPVQFEFRIAPHWYQTYWWFLLVSFVGVGMIIIGYKVVAGKMKKEHLKERAREEEIKRLLQLEVERLTLQSEKRAIELQSEQLKEHLTEKSKELANYTIQLVKKKEIFTEIQKDLAELRAVASNDKSKFKITEIFQKLSRHKIGESYMTVFDVNFEQVHGDFFKELKRRSPDLNKRELRICAFVKMNLTNKEISPLLNISVRGVETARYRIRKKLNLDHDSGLGSYLQSLANSGDDVE